MESVNFGAKAYNTEHYVNRRAEMWDLLRQWFDDPAGVQVPDSDEFQGDLTAAIRGPGAARFDSSGRLILETKDRLKERLTFSPHLGDAAALTFAVDLAAAKIIDWSDAPIVRRRLDGTLGAKAEALSLPLQVCGRRVWAQRLVLKRRAVVTVA